MKSNGFEVIFCTEPLDELCMMELKEFRDKEIVDLNKVDPLCVSGTLGLGARLAGRRIWGSV